MQTEQQIKQRLNYLKGYYDGLNEHWTWDEDVRIKAKIEELNFILESEQE
jgi:hypothetical protein